MKIDLPLENWVDLFGLVPREQLVELLPQIDDRQFAKVLQFFLNKCGQITIGSLDIEKDEEDNIIVKKDEEDAVIVEKDEEGSIIGRSYIRKLPLADVPMPSNINNFRNITIRSNCEFDPSIMAFLQQFQMNSLLVNVNLQFNHCNAKVVLEFLTKILPMITSINSVNARGQTRNNNLLGLLETKFSSDKRMLTSARVLNTWYSLDVDWVCRWLYTPRYDGKPRVLAHYYAPNRYNSLLERVKKDFMEATQPISFFLRFYLYWTEIQPLILENVQTHETVVIKSADNMLISRYPTGVSEECIKEMSQYKDWEYRNIHICGNDIRYQWGSCSSDRNWSLCATDSDDEISHYLPEINAISRVNGMVTFCCKHFHIVGKNYLLALKAATLSILPSAKTYCLK